MTLFGTLSPTLTFKLKIQTWLEVRNQLRSRRVDELITCTETLGKENPSLVSIFGGMDSGNNIQASEHTFDASMQVTAVRKTADRVNFIVPSREPRYDG